MNTLIFDRINHTAAAAVVGFSLGFSVGLSAGLALILVST